jgi:hypothetical protein
MGIHTRHVCNGTANTSGAGRSTRRPPATSVTRFAPRTRPEMKPARLPREWKASAERPKCNHAPWAEVRSVWAFASSCTSMTKRSGTYIEQISRCPEFCVRQARQQRLDMRRGDVAPLFTEVRGTGILGSSAGVAYSQLESAGRWRSRCGSRLATSRACHGSPNAVVHSWRLPTAYCVEIDPHKPCMYEWLNTPFGRTVFTHHAMWANNTEIRCMLSLTVADPMDNSSLIGDGSVSLRAVP